MDKDERLEGMLNQLHNAKKISRPAFAFDTLKKQKHRVY